MCLLPSPEDRKPDFLRWSDHPVLDNYEIIKDLGKGGFSEIILARHIITKEYVALKIIFFKNPALSNETRELLLQEATLLQQLDNKNIVKVKEVVPGPTALVIVMELLQGGNILDRLFALSHAYSEKDAAGVFTQVAAALYYLHQHNIIHRDLKPENVMFTQVPSPGSPTPNVKVIDLGLAYLYDPKVMESGCLGSAGFVSPETIQGKEHTPAMDIYSLGVLLFIMLVGRKPFNNTENENLKYAFMQLKEAPGLQDPRWLDLSPDAKDLVMGMLAFDPARRLTAEEVLNHEWVVSQGGMLERPLGQDVAISAAAVADLRRLRNLVGGAVALRRVANAAAASNIKHDPTDIKQRAQSDNLDRLTAQARVEAERKQPAVKKPRAKAKGISAGAAPTTTEEYEEYLRQRRIIQKKEGSVRAGNALRGLAAKIAGKSYAKMHDYSVTAGGTVHNRATLSPNSSNRGGSEVLKRSATAVMLSDLVASLDSSVHGGSMRGGKAAKGVLSRKSPTGGNGGGIGVLAASMKHYLDAGDSKSFVPSAESKVPE